MLALSVAKAVQPFSEQLAPFVGQVAPYFQDIWQVLAQTLDAMAHATGPWLHKLADATAPYLQVPKSTAVVLVTAAAACACVRAAKFSNQECSSGSSRVPISCSCACVALESSSISGLQLPSINCLLS